HGELVHREKKKMKSIASRIAAVAAITLAAGLSPDGYAQVTSQGWTPEVSQGLWFTSQGSRILPAKWFAVLEQSGNSTLFRVEAGYGRLGGVGNHITEVLVPALSGANKPEPPDAPVSYPFLWDTPQHHRVQWNGIAPNNVLGLGALSRNTSEVIGVFGGLRLE